MRQCTQKLCELQKTGKCPICSECKAPPDKVSDDNCVNCWCCEHDAGFIRNGKSTTEADQKVKIIIIQPTGE